MKILAAPDFREGLSFVMGDEERKNLEGIARYFYYLATRDDLPNTPEVYGLLAANARSMSRGEMQVWQPGSIGLEAAAQEQARGFLPQRERCFLNGSGEVLESETSGRPFRIGGVTDMDYLRMLDFAGKVIYATYGVRETPNPQLSYGPELSLEKVAADLRTRGVPFIVQN